MNIMNIICFIQLILRGQCEPQQWRFSVSLTIGGFLCVEWLFKKMKGVGLIQWERDSYQESAVDGLQVIVMVCQAYHAAVQADSRGGCASLTCKLKMYYWLVFFFPLGKENGPTYYTFFF